MDKRWNIHVDRTLLCKNLGCLGSLVVEGNVRADFLHECDFLIRASRGDDYGAVALGELNDQAEEE